MQRLLRRLVFLSSIPLAACGGPQAPVKAPATDGATDSRPSTIAQGPSPDLSTVAAPAELIAVGRMSDPAAAIDTVANWAKFPVDIRALVSKNEPDVGRLLVYDAPVEFAVALDTKGLGNFPQPFAVASIGLSSVEGTVEFAKRQGHSVRMLRPGTYRITKGESPVCAVAAAAGKAPARLVCGDRQEDVDALLAYATRGLPSENLGKSDLHIEVRGEPLRRRYGKELRQLKTMAAPFVMSELSLDSPRFDRALADAVHGLSDEILALVDDVDRIGIDATLDKKGGMADATIAMKFKGKSSWTVQTMLDAQKRAKGAPEAFWKLPKDSEMATFGVGANAKRYEAIRKTLAELMDGALEKEKVPRNVRDQISDLLLETWTTEGDVVYAHSEVSAPAAASSGMRERIRSQLGWYVVGLEEKPAKYKAYLDRLVNLYNDAQLRQVLDKRLKVKPADLPKLTSRAARGPGMPVGTTIYELNLPSAFFDKMDPVPPMPPGAKPMKRAPAAALSVVLVLMPDGDRSWLGLSADEKALMAQLAAVKKGESTLAQRDGLGALKAAKGVSGGYLTLGNFVRSVANGMKEAQLDADIGKAMAKMPNHGETPMLMWTTVSDGAAPDVVWTFRVPKAVVEDIAAIAPALAASSRAVPMPETAPPPPPVPARPKALTKPKKP